MSLDTILNLPVLEDDFSYNAKWTLLMHVRQIVKSDGFKHIWEKSLGDQSFFDSTPIEFGQYPQFGVEYMGIRDSTGTDGEPIKGGIYVIAYRGSSNRIEMLNQYGIDSRSRNLQFLHDSILLNLVERGDASTGMLLYNFRNKDNPPEPFDRRIKLELLESTFTMNPSNGTRQEGFDIVYFVKER